MIHFDITDNYKNKILNYVKAANPDDPIEYVNNIVKEYAFTKINEKIKNCNKCSICNKQVEKKTYGCGDVMSPILFIGDNMTLEQFSNNEIYNNAFDYNNNVLFDLLSKRKLDINKFAYFNCVNCFPYKTKQNNSNIIEERPPYKNELDNCKEYIEKAISIINPKVIVLLGNIPLKLFFNESLMKLHGEPLEINGILTMATYNPLYFSKMKNILNDNQLKNDLITFNNEINSVLDYIQTDYIDKYNNLKI